MDHRLFDAARTGDITKLKFLLKEDPLLLERFSSLPSQDNPLHVSTFSGQPAFTKEILSHKQDLALEPNQQGFSPLHIASASGNIDVVKALLSIGRKRDVCFLEDNEGLIPLHLAVLRGRIDVVKLLVSSFPESLGKVTASLETPLHVAVKNSQVEATKLLLEEIKKHKMSERIVNVGNREGNSILHLATLGKQLQILEMLIGDEAILRGSVDHFIATLTFSGVLQPPGAFKSDGNNTTIQPSLVLKDIFGRRNSSVGQAVMADRPVQFTLYAAFNAIGFLVSVAMISLLTKLGSL